MPDNSLFASDAEKHPSKASKTTNSKDNQHEKYSKTTNTVTQKATPDIIYLPLPIPSFLPSNIISECQNVGRTHLSTQNIQMNAPAPLGYNSYCCNAIVSHILNSDKIRQQYHQQQQQQLLKYQQKCSHYYYPSIYHHQSHNQHAFPIYTPYTPVPHNKCTLPQIYPCPTPNSNLGLNRIKDSQQKPTHNEHFNDSNCETIQKLSAARNRSKREDHTPVMNSQIVDRELHEKIELSNDSNAKSNVINAENKRKTAIKDELNSKIDSNIGVLSFEDKSTNTHSLKETESRIEQAITTNFINPQTNTPSKQSTSPHPSTSLKLQLQKSPTKLKTNSNVSTEHNTTNTDSKSSSDTQNTTAFFTNTRKHKCNVCGKSFKTASHLGRHRTIHTGARNFVCPYQNCGRRFSRKDNCNDHYKIHLKDQKLR